MMIRAQVDDTTPFAKVVLKPVTFVQNYLSLWRGWSMFAPNPLRSNSFIDAKVTFSDGTFMVWDFPRPSTSNFSEKYFYGERFRKYSVDGLRKDNNSHLWPDAAKYVLRKIAKNYYKKIPLKVTLRRRWRNIPDWNQQFITHKKQNTSKFNTYNFYTYEVFNATSRN